jgi:hypothetical protein
MVSPQSRVIVASYAKRRRSSERMFASGPALAALCRRHLGQFPSIPGSAKTLPGYREKIPGFVAMSISNNILITLQYLA